MFLTGPLEYVAMDTLDAITKTIQGNQFLVVKTDRFKKLAKTIPTPKTKATTVPRIFLEHCVTNHGIPSKLITDNCL